MSVRVSCPELLRRSQATSLATTQSCTSLAGPQAGDTRDAEAHAPAVLQAPSPPHSESPRVLALNPMERVVARSRTPVEPLLLPRNSASTPKVPTESTAVPAGSEGLTERSKTPSPPVPGDGGKYVSEVAGQTSATEAMSPDEDSWHLPAVMQHSTPGAEESLSLQGLSQVGSPRSRTGSQRASIASEAVTPQAGAGSGGSGREREAKCPQVGGLSDPDQATERSPWVPYSRRVERAARPAGHRPGAPSPPRQATAAGRSHSAEAEVQARGRQPRAPAKRFQALYQDHEMRQRRWLERRMQRRKEEEDGVGRQLQPSGSQRAFDRSAFQDWYFGSVGHHQQAEQARKEQQRAEERRRLKAELAECSFAPRALRKGVAAAKRPGTGAASSARNSTGGRRREEAIVEELIAAQAVQVAAMRRLDELEQQQQAELQHEVAKQLDAGMEENRRKLRRFAETQEGQAYLTERARHYVELNRGLSESAALAEAEQDLVKASEAKLRSDAEAASLRRAHCEQQRLQLERLKAAWELIQLQRRCETLLSTGELSEAALQGFDLALVDRVTSEAWYLEARDAAQRKLDPEAPSASEAPTAHKPGSGSA